MFSIACTENTGCKSRFLSPPEARESSTSGQDGESCFPYDINQLQHVLLVLFFTEKVIKYDYFYYMYIGMMKTFSTDSDFSFIERDDKRDDLYSLLFFRPNQFYFKKHNYELKRTAQGV